MSAWIFIFLDQEPEWRDKVIKELQSLLDNYAPASRGFASTAARFSEIPPEAWENEMPILEVSLFGRKWMQSNTCFRIVYVRQSGMS
jgi:hypothetical protein